MSPIAGIIYRPDGIMRRFFRNYAEFFPKLCGKNRKLCGNYADCAISFIIKFQCNKRSHWFKQRALSESRARIS